MIDVVAVTCQPVIPGCFGASQGIETSTNLRIPHVSVAPMQRNRGSAFEALLSSRRVLTSADGGRFSREPTERTNDGRDVCDAADGTRKSQDRQPDVAAFGN